MDTEQSPEPGPASEWHVGTPASPQPGAAPAPSRRGIDLGRIAIGFVTIFIVGSLLYGPNMTLMAAGMLVICTVGIGLIPLVLVSWLVGWVELAIWDAIQSARRPEGPSVAAGASGG